MAISTMIVIITRYLEALTKFTAAQQMLGYSAHLSYNTALCHYRLKDFAPALKNIADIIERGIREHPELSVGMQTEGIEVALNYFSTSFLSSLSASSASSASSYFNYYHH